MFGDLDYVRERLRNRLEGLSTSEHLWEPVPEVWTVRDAADQWVVDGGRPSPIGWCRSRPPHSGK